MLFSLWILLTLTFLLLRFFPGSPFDEEVSLHPSVQAQIEATYHLHRPVYEQYFHYMNDLIHGNLGVSQFFAGKTVSSIILAYVPNTLILNFLALTLAFVVAVLLALWGLQEHRGARGSFEAITLCLLSMPTLLAGPILILVFGHWLNLFPVALLEQPSSYVLPVIVLAIKPIASLSRLLESSLRQNSVGDDLRTMKAMGVSPWRILTKYNLKKSLVPAFSFFGGLAAVMMGGSAIIEIIFALPGMGSQFIEAVMNRDSSLVLGLTLCYGSFILVFQCLIDLTLPLLDPRI